MAELRTEGRRAYRLPPCPAWDVEGMERWLEDMAERGFFLAKDGFFAGFAAFDCGAPLFTGTNPRGQESLRLITKKRLEKAAAPAESLYYKKNRPTSETAIFRPAARRRPI